jgi:hypothetical protein
LGDQAQGFGSAASRLLEALNKRRFLGAFGPMIDFERARAYKSVHNTKLRFWLISPRLWFQSSASTAALRHSALIYRTSAHLSIGPMISFKRVRAYKNVHNAKLHFSHR